jgi:CheY-like chemotaxis protein
MSPKSPLEDKIILVVDDEPDVLETVGEMLEMCLLYKAKSYEEALEYLKGYTIDIAVLDIMGVNGFELLKRSVEKGIPTVMLTAHALTPEGEGKPIWGQFFDRLGTYFEKRFGPDWKEKDKFFTEFEEAVRGGTKQE